MKIRQEGAELFQEERRAVRQTDSNDQAIIDSSQFCERVFKGYECSVVIVPGLQHLY